LPTIVFDIRANHDTGVSRYGLCLLAVTAPLIITEGWRLVVVARPVQEERARTAVTGLGAEVEICPDDEGFVRRSEWLRELLVQERVDLYYTSHYTVDLQCPVPFVFTIHDLTRLRFPALSYNDASFADRFGRAELDLIGSQLAELSAWDEAHDGEALFTRYFRVVNRCLAERASRVTVVSRATAGDVISLLDADPARIDLVPCGVDTSVFFRQDDMTVASVRAARGLAGPYLVFVGLAHPNKRFPWLVEQLLDQRDRLPETARLVAVGGHAEQVPDVARLIAERGGDNLIVFTGRVSDQELAALYSGAAALVTASVNEGNNLPPLEAMACGSQVIATDVPPLRETLGGAASFYDPRSGEALIDLAEQALTGRLPDRARTFRPPTWPDSGRLMVETLRKAMPATAQS
jgi:glycosyltransferase involved in cell wall biosynthesis